MNTRIIQPKQVWNNGEKTATILSLVNFSNYHFDNGGGTVSYQLIGMESKEEGMPESAVTYFNGDLTIPADVIQQWGESDNIIWDYVATTLQITFA